MVVAWALARRRERGCAGAADGGRPLRRPRSRFVASSRTSAPAPTSPTPAPTRSASSSTRRTRTSPTSGSSISPPRSPPGSPRRAANASTSSATTGPARWSRASSPRSGTGTATTTSTARRGVGGVSVRNFRLGGTPQSASPFVPAAYAPYFDEAGGGGVEVLLESNPDPSCASKVDTPEERDRRVRRGGGVAVHRAGRRVRGQRIGKARPRYRPTSGCCRGSARLRYARSRSRRLVPGRQGRAARRATRLGRAVALLTSGAVSRFAESPPATRSRRAQRLLDLKRCRQTRAAPAPRARARQATRAAWRARDRIRWILVDNGAAAARETSLPPAQQTCPETGLTCPAWTRTRPPTSTR